MNTGDLLRQDIEQKNLEAIRDKIESQPQLLYFEDYNTKRTPIFWVASSYEDDEAVSILQYFLNAGADGLHEDINNRTITFTLCARGLKNCLNLISMKYDGILLHQDRLGQTPLFSAVRANQYELIKQLSIPLDMINLPDKLAGHSLLFYSAACRNDDLCCLLVRKGANVLAKDLCGQSILSYTSKTPKFAQLAKNLIKKAAKQQVNNRSAIIEEHEDEMLRNQAYQLQAIKNNKIIRLTAEEKCQMIEKYRQHEWQCNNSQPSCLEAEKVYRDDYDEYEQNWRHNAIKIVDSCLHLKSGKWFEHTSKAYTLLSEKELSSMGNLEMVDLTLISFKLQHHVYQNSNQFYGDMSKIWGNCSKMNIRDNLILKYAEELQKHAFALMVEYNLF